MVPQALAGRQLGDLSMSTQVKAKIAAFRIIERMMDRTGVLMLLVLGLATAGATLAAGF